jgi:hypothetical protein
MTGLLAGRLTDAAGLDAVRADLAGVVWQVLGPARVSLRISQCAGRTFSDLACGTRRSEDDRQKVSEVRFAFIVLVGRPEMAKPGDQLAGGRVSRGRLLASHADREQVIDKLKEAFVQGLLTKDEFDLRVGQTLGSRTYGELGGVTADIPRGPIGAQLPPKLAQAQARTSGYTAVKSGVCTLAAVILAASTSVAVVSGRDAAVIISLFLLGIGVIVAVIAALLAAGIRMLESWDEKRSSGQLPPRSSPGAGGQASQCLAAGAPAGQFRQVDHGQQRTAEAVRSDLAGLQSSGSQPPRQRRSRGLLAAGRTIAVQTR